jgi:recombination associated protein RdgC
MFFKSANVYRLHDAPEHTAETLNDMLKGDAAKPLGNADAKRHGWTPPASRNAELFMHEVQGHRLFSMLKQERLLPGSVIKDAVEEQVEALEEKEGRFLTRKEKSSIKEQVTESLLPRAFIKTTKVFAWWDVKRGRITVNSASRSVCEDLLDLLRETLGSLKVTPHSTQTLPVRAMTTWLHDTAQGTLPANLNLGDVITLKDKGDDGVWRGRQIDPDSDEIQQMLETGRQAVELAMTVNDNVSFTLNDSLTLKSLRFGDKLLEEADAQDDGDDATARLEADFYLMANALAEAIDSLTAMMGGETERAVPVSLDEPDTGTHPGEQLSGIRYEEDLLPTAAALASEYNTKRENLTVSKLQRHFKIGYNRAQRLQEYLISKGHIPNPYGQRGA